MIFPLFKYNTVNNPNLFFIAGPCVVESEDLCRRIAERLATTASKHNVDIVFKASYDKANRLSKESFRGVGRQKGLKILAKIKKEFGLPILTDIHEPSQAKRLQKSRMFFRSLLYSAARPIFWLPQERPADG